MPDAAAGYFPPPRECREVTAIEAREAAALLGAIRIHTRDDEATSGDAVMIAEALVVH